MLPLKGVSLSERARHTTAAAFFWRASLLLIMLPLCLVETRSLSSARQQDQLRLSTSRDVGGSGVKDDDASPASPNKQMVSSAGALIPAVRARRRLVGSASRRAHTVRSPSISGNNKDTPYLVTVFGMDAEDETQRMGHFLHHYLDKLGVLPERCIFVLHSRHGEKAVSQGRSILASRGIQPKRVLLRQAFDVQLATVLVRELLDEEGVTKADQWVLRVDSDELVTFEDAEEMIRALRHRSPEGCNYFMLHLIDRVAPNGSLPHIQPIETGKSLFDQFPNQCLLTKNILKGAYHKASIHTGTMRTGPGHHRCDETYSREEPYACRNDLSHLDVSHFKWVESVRPRLERRQKEYEALGYYWSAESARLLEYLDENSNRIDVEHICKHPVNSTSSSGSDESDWEKLKHQLHPGKVHA